MHPVHPIVHARQSRIQHSQQIWRSSAGKAEVTNPSLGVLFTRRMLYCYQHLLHQHHDATFYREEEKEDEEEEEDQA